MVRSCYPDLDTLFVRNNPSFFQAMLNTMTGGLTGSTVGSVVKGTRLFPQIDYFVPGISIHSGMLF